MVSVQILKQQKNINQISIFTIATLSRVLFLLMGRVPENTNSKISKRKKYTLNDLRTLVYIQSDIQKANTIRYAIEHRLIDDLLMEQDVDNLMKKTNTEKRVNLFLM